MFTHKLYVSETKRSSYTHFLEYSPFLFFSHPLMSTEKGGVVNLDKQIYVYMYIYGAINVVSSTNYLIHLYKDIQLYVVVWT